MVKTLTRTAELPMIHDGVLDAARTTLSTLPDADQLLAELKAQLALGDATHIQLRSDMRQILSEYRAWRVATRCGSTGSNILLLHPTYMKQARRIWTTYRLTQLLLRDMRAMAGLRMQSLETRQRIPAAYLRAAPMPVAANEQTAAFNDDGISYEALEMRYGPAMAQRLYDEIMLQLQYDRTRSVLTH